MRKNVRIFFRKDVSISGNDICYGMVQALFAKLIQNLSDSNAT